MRRITWTTLLTCSAFAATGCGGGSGTPPAEPNIPQAVGQHSAAITPAASAPAAQTEQPPVVLLRTSLGDISVRLLPDRAPCTVQNFLNYVASGHYDGTIFHHVDRHYVALGGGFTPELQEKPVRYPIRNEADNGLKNLRGTIAMYRQLDAIDSSVCQFFINLADNPKLDHQGPDPERFGFCVFGEIESGLEVLDKINAVETNAANGFDCLPVQTVLLQSARRVR